MYQDLRAEGGEGHEQSLYQVRILDFFHNHHIVFLGNDAADKSLSMSLYALVTYTALYFSISRQACSIRWGRFNPAWLRAGTFPKHYSVRYFVHHR